MRTMKELIESIIAKWIHGRILGGKGIRFWWLMHSEVIQTSSLLIGHDDF